VACTVVCVPIYGVPMLLLLLGSFVLFRVVEIRRTSAFLTVITVPYRKYAVQYGASPVYLKLRCPTVQYGATVQYILTVGRPFGSNSGPKHFFSFCNKYI